MFRKDIEPSCAYCARGAVLSDGNVICEKFGLISPAADCSKFRYDPLKRIPPRPPVLPEYDADDFTI